MNVDVLILCLIFLFLILFGLISIDLKIENYLTKQRSKNVNYSRFLGKSLKIIDSRNKEKLPNGTFVEIKQVNKSSFVFRFDGKDYDWLFKRFEIPKIESESVPQNPTENKPGFFTRIMQPKQGVKVMEKLKSYLERNSDMFFTVGLLILLDHLVFDGAFRERIKGVMGKLLDKTTKQIESKSE